MRVLVNGRFVVPRGLLSVAGTVQRAQSVVCVLDTRRRVSLKRRVGGGSPRVRLMDPREASTAEDLLFAICIYGRGRPSAGRG